MTETIELTAQDGFTSPAYVARPAQAPRGAVVVLQEIFGVNSHIRAVADGYARQGYLAVAPALFHRVRHGVELGYTAADVEQGRMLKAAAEALPAPGVRADVAAAVAYGASQAGKVGAVGYCWGGLVAWRSACLLPGLAAAVAYYGGGMTVGEEPARKPLCPVMCHFGEQDHAIALDGVHAFAKAQPQTEVHVYPAQHGFNCDQRASFDAPAAALALERTLAFLARHLG
ncbi:MAG: dienelactone hydrolase family protein [Burkholderiaceae bacterium]|nr:dienelactone hydrolase family protein [Rhodoferax sp.]MCB2008575.1 dienelactone hydrolase family protein [Rhodoferax sp.]MCB2027503.1 dienelactone hydrolase family protein [Rhodoferax sp.]MCP5261076.1 dienelactone hydrolase family protein [Rhodoferax sp.]MCW5640587.1 dienelactone hydrolase family protein [Rhodoferax sp.]